MKAMKFAPLNCKKKNYLTNGTGRDTYIHFNNGGINKKAKINIPIHNKKFAYKSYKMVRPKSTPKIINYQPDGTGRDVYIKKGGGGFIKVSQKTNTNIAFENCLRNYEAIKLKPKRPDSAMKFNKTQNSNFNISCKNFSTMNKVFNSQNFLNERLSKPKNINTPFYKILMTTGFKKKFVETLPNDQRYRNIIINKITKCDKNRI